MSPKITDAYIEKNSDCIKQYVIPAYEQLKQGITSLRETGTNSGGLCHLPKGIPYYESLVATETGSSRSIPELQQLTKKQIKEDLFSIQKTLSDISDDQPSPSSDFFKSQGVVLEDSNPSAILSSLKSNLSGHFPAPPNVNVQIKYVSKEMENYLSPAFYLSPPIDSNNRNCIYINNSSKNNGQNLFSTIAHEGVPGHMYQSDFFASTNPMPIRHIVNFGGYSEGWATYAELFSYKYQYNNEQLANLFSCNTSFSLALYSLCDIGINYEGWNRSKTYKFLNNYGVEDTEVQKSIYEAVIEEPANYLQYYVGYLEIINLRNDLMKNIGADFKIKKFHDAFLAMGPTSFDVARKWIKHFYNLSSD